MCMYLFIALSMADPFFTHTEDSELVCQCVSRSIIFLLVMNLGTFCVIFR